mmetsp:Transcript_44253/g.134758  ORF Transcript_44253/g.134758 Transcript_44253/m.134758 type:complete len:215 (+) Transcript_44253:94-738(+)
MVMTTKKVAAFMACLLIIFSRHVSERKWNCQSLFRKLCRIQFTSNKSVLNSKQRHDTKCLGPPQIIVADPRIMNLNVYCAMQLGTLDTLSPNFLEPELGIDPRLQVVRALVAARVHLRLDSLQPPQERIELLDVLHHYVPLVLQLVDQRLVLLQVARFVEAELRDVFHAELVHLRQLREVVHGLHLGHERTRRGQSRVQRRLDDEAARREGGAR